MLRKNLETYPSWLSCSFTGKISHCVSSVITHLFVSNSAHLLFKDIVQKPKQRTNCCQKLSHWSSKLKFFCEPSECFLAVSARLKKSLNATFLLLLYIYIYIINIYKWKLMQFSLSLKSELIFLGEECLQVYLCPAVSEVNRGNCLPDSTTNENTFSSI